jgi:cytochrome c biogenesis protein CcmG/thiol:disulfide interchange protein DsbE
MRKLPLLTFLLLACGLAAMLLQKTEPKPDGAQSNEAMPTITVATLDGKKLWDAGALNGHITLINFFASWCAPCATEMPELAALKKQFPALRMEGIAWNDDPATLKKWLKQHGDPFHQHWIDKNGDATIALGIKGIPESFIVDGHGIIRYRLAGPLTDDLREGDFGALLTQLLAEQRDAK